MGGCFQRFSVKKCRHTVGGLVVPVLLHCATCVAYTRQSLQLVILVVAYLHPFWCILFHAADKAIRTVGIAELCQEPIVLRYVCNGLKTTIRTVFVDRANTIGQILNDFSLAGLVVIRDTSGRRPDLGESAKEVILVRQFQVSAHGHGSDAIHRVIGERHRRFSLTLNTRKPVEGIIAVMNGSCRVDHADAPPQVVILILRLCSIRKMTRHGTHIESFVEPVFHVCLFPPRIGDLGDTPLIVVLKPPPHPFRPIGSRDRLNTHKRHQCKTEHIHFHSVTSKVFQASTIYPSSAIPLDRHCRNPAKPSRGHKHQTRRRFTHPIGATITIPALKIKAALRGNPVRDCIQLQDSCRFRPRTFFFASFEGNEAQSMTRAGSNG